MTAQFDIAAGELAERDAHAVTFNDSDFAALS